MICPVCGNPREIIYTPSDVHDGWRKGDRRYFGHLVCHTCKTRRSWGQSWGSVPPPGVRTIYHATWDDWPDFAEYKVVEEWTAEGLLESVRLEPLPRPEPPLTDDERFIFGDD